MKSRERFWWTSESLVLCLCRLTLAGDRPFPEPPAAAGTRFVPGISEGLSPEGTSHQWHEAVWSRKSLDLQATFGVSGSDLLQLAQVGNSFHSIWAASFARSWQLGPRSFASWAYEFGGLRLGIEVEFEIIPPLIFCFCDHSLVVVFLCIILGWATCASFFLGGARLLWSLCLLLKKMHKVRFMKSFIWGKMRIAAQETAPQRALMNCSEEVGGKVNICDFGEGEVHAIKHLSYKRFSASHVELKSPWRHSVLS